MLEASIIPLGITLQEAKTFVEQHNTDAATQVQYVKEGMVVMLDENPNRIRVWYNDDNRVFRVTRG